MITFKSDEEEIYSNYFEVDDIDPNIKTPSNDLEFQSLTQEQILKLSNDKAKSFMVWINEGYPGKGNNINTLNKIIDFCKEQNYTPVLVTTPFIEKFVKQFSDEFYVDFYSFIYEIANNKDVIYLDYSNSSIFNKRIDLFSNQDYLNSDGKQLFTEEIIKDLTNHGVYIK